MISKLKSNIWGLFKKCFKNYSRSLKNTPGDVKLLSAKSGS